MTVTIKSQWIKEVCPGIWFNTDVLHLLKWNGNIPNLFGHIFIMSPGCAPVQFIENKNGFSCSVGEKNCLVFK